MTQGRKIGEVAEATGLTIRALHHYEEIGLLTPSGRSEAGHRRYSDVDVQRLYRICLLRQLQLPLTEIGKALDDEEWSLTAAIDRHAAEIQRRVAHEHQLLSRLTGLRTSMDSSSGISADDLLTTLEEMIMLDMKVQTRIATLVSDDIAASYEFLTTVFGLGPGEVTFDENRGAVHAEVVAGDGLVWLHKESEEFGLVSPRTLGAATASIAVLVGDVDAHHEHVAAQGADVIYGPVDQPYGYREYAARDRDGHLWSFMKPLD